MKDTINTLMFKPKGILAADESFPSIEKRFKSIGLESSEELRRQYRQLLLTTPGINEFISGVILFDETIKQKADDGTELAQVLVNQGIVPGIKVDLGTKNLPNFEGEKITNGLDGLDERFKQYYELGARFSKWRAVISIGQNIPSDYAISANVDALVRFAALSQEAQIVPIVEPEVLMEGAHGIEICGQVTLKVHQLLFKRLLEAKVGLENLILKTNMVLPGKECQQQANAEQVAQATLMCLKSGVPTTVGGIVFLSGGLDEQTATDYLNKINQMGGDAPWRLTFSFGRALQNSCLEVWAGKQENKVLAQEKLLERASANSQASIGAYGNS